jgi:hypothetical protein
VISVPTYSINSFLFPEGVSLQHCFSWGREHNSEIFMKKPLLFPSQIHRFIVFVYWLINIIRQYIHGWFSDLSTLSKVTLIILTFGVGNFQTFAQSSYNPALTCATSNATPNLLTKESMAYSGLTARTVSGGANAVINESWKVKADVNGQLGFFHGIVVTALTANVNNCVNQTSNNRQFALYSYTGNICSGSSIAPATVNDGITSTQTGGSETNTLNPSWTGLTPNADYVVIVRTTVGASCTGINNTYGGYYSNVQQLPSISLCGQTVYQTGSGGFTTAALASANSGATGQTNYRIAPSTTFKQVATVKTDGNGNLGVINTILTNAPSADLNSCSANTRATRTNTEQLFLKDPITGECSGSAISKNRNGTNSSTFNPEWFGLTPNTDYLIIFTTTVNSLCSVYSSSTVSYYGFPPLFTFNCGTASTTGTFIADGSSHSGTIVVPISGTTAGSANFTVSGTGFTGTLTTTLTAGQTSVTIPITFDGTGSAGSRTLTVTSPMGGGTCTKSVTITGNTAPVITSAASVNFAENGLGIAYTTTATDVDAGQTKTYSFETGGADNAKFTINASTGAVSFITSPNFEIPSDAGANNVYDIKVKVCDNGTPVLCAIKDVAITVIDINECNAGTTAPTLSATTKSNSCPTTTADVSSLVSSTCPVGSSLEWHTISTGLSAANKVANPATVGAGMYYPTCFDATNVCYSPTPATGVTVIITTCLSITQPATQSGLQSVNKSGMVSADVAPTGGFGAISYSNGSTDPACIAPSGASALPGSSNLIINANGSYSYTTPSAVGTYYFCVKVCDSTSPTPDCKVAIYKIIVLPPPCNVGPTAPKIN